MMVGLLIVLVAVVTEVAVIGIRLFEKNLLLINGKYTDMPSSGNYN